MILYWPGANFIDINIPHQRMIDINIDHYLSSLMICNSHIDVMMHLTSRYISFRSLWFGSIDWYLPPLLMFRSFHRGQTVYWQRLEKQSQLVKISNTTSVKFSDVFIPVKRIRINLDTIQYFVGFSVKHHGSFTQANLIHNNNKKILTVESNARE